jgi:hypothetical protein
LRLATDNEHDASDRLLLPITQIRVPAPRALPASLRDLRLALGRRACTRDQETGEPGVSRRRIRFGGFPRVGARRVGPGASDSNRTSDTPVAAGRLCVTLSRNPGRPTAKIASCVPSVKMRRSLRPKVPSVAGGHSRACVNRCRSRAADTCASAMIRPSSPFREWRLHPGFHRAALPHPLGPRPRLLVTRDVHASRRQTLLTNPADAQRFLQLHFRRTDTLPSIRFSQDPSINRLSQ